MSTHLRIRGLEGRKWQKCYLKCGMEIHLKGNHFKIFIRISCPREDVQRLRVTGILPI